MISKPQYFFQLTWLECLLIAIFVGFSYLSLFNTSLVDAAELPFNTRDNLSKIHQEIDALPIAPETRLQMLVYIELAEQNIEANNLSAAREAVLDFCRRIEWYRYQIGHTKINNMFNQAMSIAVEIHNASIN